jgi:RsmE family RNA methyltransferase
MHTNLAAEMNSRKGAKAPSDDMISMTVLAWRRCVLARGCRSVIPFWIKGLPDTGRCRILGGVNMILLQPHDLDGNRSVLTDHRAAHVLDVLGSAPGDALRIGLLNGPRGTGAVEKAGGGEVVLSCAFDDEPPPRPMIDLLLAMPRPKVMKRLWAQLAALGVGRIILLRADKVERYYFDSHVLAPDFYNERLIEGLQQARCTHLPEVLVRPLFKPFVEDELDTMFHDSLKLLADPSAEKRMHEFFPISESSPRVLLAIGPEGGWIPYELDLLRAHGFETIGLGNRILRTDTAVIALLASLHEQMQRP